MRKLQGILQKHSESLDETARLEYESLSATLIDKLKVNFIPEKILLGVPHPEFLPYIEPQLYRYDSCGLNSLRSMLMLSFGYKVQEESLNKRFKRLTGKTVVQADGITPEKIARMTHDIDGRYLKRDLKVFMTKQGNFSQLEFLLEHHLLPIFHRKIREAENEEDNGGAHYELLLGLDSKYVYSLNSYSLVTTCGFYKTSRKVFINKWWPVGITNIERWYLVAIEKDIKLPMQKFSGKYI
jgi:hypothetical protein